MLVAKPLVFAHSKYICRNSLVADVDRQREWEDKIYAVQQAYYLDSDIMRRKHLSDHWLGQIRSPSVVANGGENDVDCAEWCSR